MFVHNKAYFLENKYMLVNADIVTLQAHRALSKVILSLIHTHSYYYFIKNTPKTISNFEVIDNIK